MGCTISKDSFIRMDKNEKERRSLREEKNLSERNGESQLSLSVIRFLSADTEDINSVNEEDDEDQSGGKDHKQGGTGDHQVMIEETEENEWRYSFHGTICSSIRSSPLPSAQSSQRLLHDHQQQPSHGSFPRILSYQQEEEEDRTDDDQLDHDDDDGRLISSDGQQDHFDQELGQTIALTTSCKKKKVILHIYKSLQLQENQILALAREEKNNHANNNNNTSASNQEEHSSTVTTTTTYMVLISMVTFFKAKLNPAYKKTLLQAVIRYLRSCYPHHVAIQNEEMISSTYHDEVSCSTETISYPTLTTKCSCSNSNSLHEMRSTQQSQPVEILFPRLLEPSDLSPFFLSS